MANFKNNFRRRVAHFPRDEDCPMAAAKKNAHKEAAAGDITYISCILLPQTLDLKLISLSRGLWRRYLPFLLLARSSFSRARQMLKKRSVGGRRMER